VGEVPSSEEQPGGQHQQWRKWRRWWIRGGHWGGDYLAEADNPDICNPFAAGLWELAMLRDYFFVGRVLTQGHLQELSGREYQEILLKYDPLGPIRWPTVNPNSNNKSNNKKRK
jgi:hypothetical protein